MATGLDCLASLEPESIVHADVKPGNILVEASTDTLVLGDYGVGMWQGRKTGLRVPEVLSPVSAYVAPERRLASLGPASGLSEDDRNVVYDDLFEQNGGGKLDMWSLGVVVYLLGMRKNPRGYETEAAKMMHEVDTVARQDKEWLQTELRGVWPGGNGGELELLAEVIEGTLQGLDKRPARLSAKEVLKLLGPIGEKRTT